jgi:hypothetical protein
MNQTHTIFHMEWDVSHSGSINVNKCHKYVSGGNIFIIHVTRKDLLFKMQKSMSRFSFVTLCLHGVQ